MIDPEDGERIRGEELELLEGSPRCECGHSSLLHGWTGPHSMSQCLIESCDCQECTE